MEALARRLQVSVENLLPAYDADSAEAAGYVLPIRRRQPAGSLYWSSQLWFPRPERLLLSSGDSPIGYRIPTESMPWVAPDELEYDYEPAPFADRVKLPLQSDLGGWISLRESRPTIRLPALLEYGRNSKGTDPARRSASKRAKADCMYFCRMRPKLADYLDLLAAVEDTCQYLQKPVWLEGYAPPSDPRLRSFSVTPDPGVLEVNLPPASNWDELENINTRSVRRSTEKPTDGGEICL